VLHPPGFPALWLFLHPGPVLASQCYVGDLWIIREVRSPQAGNMDQLRLERLSLACHYYEVDS
jgi:hypothetical protein